MSDLDKKFEEAAAKVKKLVSRPNDEELLDIYALFKQATMCDCTQPKPGLFQLKDKAKHEAWMKLKGWYLSSLRYDLLFDEQYDTKEFMDIRQLILTNQSRLIIQQQQV